MLGRRDCQLSVVMIASLLADTERESLRVRVFDPLCLVSQTCVPCVSAGQGMVVDIGF